MGGSVGKFVGSKGGGALLGGLVGGPLGAAMGYSMGGKTGAPTLGGQQTPMQMLQSTGGAALLMNVALGANVDDSIASFLGISKKQLSTGEGLSAQDISAIGNIRNQLGQIQGNTELKNRTVQKLANDFPNIMQAKIQQYSSIADDTTKQMMDQALNQISAKYAAGGQLSSGAMAEAAAKAGAGLGMDKLNYATGLAGQDWANQYNNATALQSFQQKMLGQGAAQGFNAVQNALASNNQINLANFNAQNQQNMANQQQQTAMFQGVGQLGGTLLGGAMFGPMGAYAGQKVGGAATGGMSGPNTDSIMYQPNNNSNRLSMYGR